MKLDVGGMNSEIVMFGDERVIDEKDIGFKVSDKEMEGGGDEGVLFWMIREDSEYFEMGGKVFIDNKIDCKVSEKNEYEMKLDDYYDEVNELSERVF